MALFVVSGVCAFTSGAGAQTGPITREAEAPASSAPVDQPGIKERLLTMLPAPVSDGLDIDGWIWLGYDRNNQHSSSHYEDAELSLAITKSFSKSVAATVQGNLIDATGYGRVQLEQFFVTAVAFEKPGTLVTIGIFNANFGIEARDFWDRTTGTTSPLFGAQPQDLVGLMVTQPIGDTGITLRPLVSADFQGEYDFNQSPAAALQAEYRPNRQFNFSVTNWVGPGIVPSGGHALQYAYNDNGYGENAANLIANWQGPNINADRGGTLYFLNANAVWRPRNDLTLSAEYVMGTTGTRLGRVGWAGFMGLVNYDLTDHWALFGRVTYLDDNDGLLTGSNQRVYETSGGVSYAFTDKLEMRGEYRHDSSNINGNADTVSIHLTAGF